MYPINFDKNKKLAHYKGIRLMKWSVIFFTLQKCKVNVSEIEGTSFRKVRTCNRKKVYVTRVILSD